MSEATLAPRAEALLDRLDSWAGHSPVRAVLVKVAVTVAGPLVILAGIAMLVLPGPGLVVMAAGLALLALEYSWARHVLGLLGRTMSRARAAPPPKDAAGGRRALGAVLGAGGLVAGFVATTAVTAFLGAHTVL